MNKTRIIKMNFVQLMSSPLYSFSILATSVVFYASIQEYIDNSVSVSYLIDLFLGLSMPKKLVVLLAAIPCSTSFCSDWNFQFIKPVITRCGIKRYVFSKLLTSFCSAFLISFLGISIGCLLLMTKFPLFLSDSLSTDVHPPFEALASGSASYLYIYALISVFSLAVATWSCVGLTISAYIPNYFVAFTSAIVSSYILEEFTTLLPTFLDLYRITASRDVINKGAILSFTYFLFVFLLYTFCAGFLFYRQVTRRIRSDVI